MIEDDFPGHAARFRSFSARVPGALTVTYPRPRKVLVVGSCLSAQLVQTIDVPADFVLFNGGLLPELPDAVGAYDFQIIQIPLRQILADDALWHLRHQDLDAFDQAFSACLEKLTLYFHQFTGYCRAQGLTALLCNFIVPSQNPAGRLCRRYSRNNLQHFIHELNAELETLCLGLPQCHLLDLDGVACSHGKRYYLDEALFWFSHNGLMPHQPDPDDARRMEPTPHIVEHFELFDQRIFLGAVFIEAVAMWRTLRQIDTVKLIVVDLDDTLWKGISGELENVERVHSAAWPEPLVPMTEGWPLGIAEALMYCKQRGVLLGILSKNDEERIRRNFAAIFDGKLALEDFAICRINWDAKPSNMRIILSTLNVLPENVLFIDDNPVERTAMATAYPAMRVIGRYYQYTRSILLWSAETQSAIITDESSRRTEMTQAQVQRETLRQFASETDFLATLQVRMHVFEIDSPGHPGFPRALELINKTNQWNATGRRVDHTQLSTHLQEGARLFGMSVADRFTQYGDIGYLLCDGDQVPVFVMSCRVIGLQVESRFLQEVMNTLGVQALHIAFSDTGKNVVIHRYLDTQGVPENSDTYRIEAAKLPAASHIAISA